MASSNQEYNEKVCLAVLMAPIAYLNHIKNKIVELLVAESPLLQSVYDATGAGVGELLGRQQPTHQIIDAFCMLAPETICNIIVLAVGGDLPGSIARPTLELIGKNYPSGTSFKNIKQFGQVIKSGKFANYDYGPEENSKRYGSQFPPEYDLSKVSAPVVLVSGRGDTLSVIADVDRLRLALPNVVDHYIVPDRTWGHGNCIWGKRMKEYITLPLLNYFKNVL